ncbi:MAG: M36 family metallopeptidase [Myxococcaceae bacterium]|nr:M36 family metallopeptidase [Myxococcaceae bacterium]
MWPVVLVSTLAGVPTPSPHVAHERLRVEQRPAGAAPSEAGRFSPVFEAGLSAGASGRGAQGRRPAGTDAITRERRLTGDLKPLGSGNSVIDGVARVDELARGRQDGSGRTLAHDVFLSSEKVAPRTVDLDARADELTGGLLDGSGRTPAHDVFLASEKVAPRTIDLDARARAVAAGVFISQWDERLGVPTSVFLPAPPPGTRSPRDEGLTAAEVTRRVLLAVGPLYGFDGATLAQAPLTVMQEGGLGAVVVTVSRRVGEVPVFRERLAVVLSPQLVPIGLLGALPPHGAPELRFPVSAETALRTALEFVGGRLLPERDVRVVGVDAAGVTRHHGGARSRRVLYATDSELVPAWHLELDAARDALSLVVSALDGRVLSRASRRFDAAHGYRVWANATAPFTPLQSPEGDASPHPTGLPDGWAPAMLTPAVLVTLDHAGLSTMDPWLPAGATSLSGNNAVAYADVFAPDGRNDPTLGLPRFPDGGQPPGEVLPDGGSTRQLADPLAAPVSATFDFAWNPAVGPTSTDVQSHAAATHAFFVTNWLHDVWYEAGFTERARNAQVDNKGRGGVGGDPLLVEVNDFAGDFGADLLVPADGTSPRLQLYPARRNGRAVVTFSPALPDAGTGAAPLSPRAWSVTGSVVAVQSLTDGGLDVCAPLGNGAALAGRVALGRIGFGCALGQADDAVADAGAVGLLLVNGPDTRDDGVQLPTHVLTPEQSAGVLAALGAGSVSATLESVPLVDRPTALDSTVVAHEWGHLLAGRLVGDGAGLESNQARALVEGFSDVVAVLSFLEEADATRPGNSAWSGAWAVGAFSASDRAYDGTFLDPHLFGLRRYPLSSDVMKNPLTLRHIAANVPLPTTAPQSRTGGAGPDNAAPANAGEVWAVAFWDGATRLLRSPSVAFPTARDSLRRLVVASLSALPPNATFVEARDAVLMSARASSPTELQAFLEGFAARGLGLLAQTPNRRSLTNTPVAEDFMAMGARWTVLDIRLVDDVDGCDADGVLDVGEKGRAVVTLLNVGSRPLTNSRVTLSADDMVLVLGMTSAMVTADPFQKVEVSVPAEVRSTIMGVAQARVFVTATDGLVEQSPAFRWFRLNVDEVPAARERFEGNVSGWEFGRDGVPWENGFRVNAPAGQLLQSTLVGANSASAGLSWATTPPLVAGPGALSFSFEHTASFEFDRMALRYWDGGQLRVSVNGGPFTPIPGSAISRTVAPTAGYDGPLEVATANPLAGQEAFRGQTARTRVSVALGDQYAGQTLRVQWLIGTDVGGGATGWTIDDVTFTGLANQPFSDVVTHRGQCSNRPPAFATALPVFVDERTRATLVPPQATDPNGDMLTYTWRQASGPTVVLDGASFDAPEVGDDTLLTFVVTANDGRGGTATATVTVTVRNINRPPTSNAGPPQTVRSGDTVTLAAAASDLDGDQLTVRWSQVSGPEVTLSSLSALDGTFVAPEVTRPSEVTLELNVRDSGGAAAAPSVLTVVVTPRGCGCSSFEGLGGLGLLAVGALLRSRRRRQTGAVEGSSCVGETT